MTINFITPEANDHLKPRITVIGCGGAGGNAVNNMITQQLEGVEFVVANTDAQALAQSLADRRVQLGRAITHGLGAGSRPDMGRAAAEEAMEDIGQILNGSHMIFIAAGMGGGTGTGAAPVIARLAREQGMLTVGVVTKPFQFEGSNRMRIADAGIEEMQQFVDTLIVIPNQNLFRIANEKTTFADAFAMADDVLHSGVRGVTDLMVVPGLINLDFADIRSVMSEMGKAMMGTGEADGEERAKLAAEAAISNPLLDDVSMKGARGVLINITGGPDMTLFEVDEAANRIGDEVDPNANIIFGSATDPSLEGRIRVSVVATGIDIEAASHQPPVLKVYSDPIAPKIDPKTASAAATNVITDIPATAAATTIMSGGGAAAALKISETQPSIEQRDLEQGNLEGINTPIQTDIITFVDTEVQKESSSETGGDGVFAKNEEENLEDPKSDLLGENFIPPAPSEPTKASPARTVAAADPFREAEMLNPAPVPEQKPTPNIFQRMTGGNWSKRNSSVEQKDKLRNFVSPVETSKPIETKNVPKNEPLEERPTSQREMPDEDLVLSSTPVSKDNREIQSTDENVPENTKTEALIKPSAANPTLEKQPRLRGVEAKKRLPDSQNEEDLLEIPAFLRRQAN